MSIPTGWRRVRGAFTVRPHAAFGTRWVCAAGCHNLSAVGSRACQHCHQPFLVRKARRRVKVAPDDRIEKRLAVTRRAIDVALDDFAALAKRIAGLRGRLSRLEAAARTPAEERRARAAKGLETRAARGRSPRGITIRHEEGP